jgi:S-adenosylmethionine synthetase
MAARHLFTSESVTEGHPDKIADQISDAVLDALIAQDPRSRVACETLVTTGLAIVAGEISSRAYVEIPELVRKVIGRIGYDSAEYGFDSHTCAVMTTIDNQSPDIAMGVNTGGAGDQGLMFGFACRETPQLMPLPIMLAHGLTRRLAFARRRGLISYLRPDGKSQVTVEYEGLRPIKVDTVVVSSQHADGIPQARIRRDIIKHVIDPVIPKRFRKGRMTLHINPTGSFVKGGPMADTGLTGRKIIVDTYGGVGSHGGGAFSGKDPTKVDRSASYGARYVAKNLVASGLCDRVEVQLAYAIGVAEPVSIMVDSNGTGKVSDKKLTDLVRKHFDLTPQGLITTLKLRRPIFQATAAYGHFGRTEASFTWERTDKARLLAKSV